MNAGRWIGVAVGAAVIIAVGFFAGRAMRGVGEHPSGAEGSSRDAPNDTETPEETLGPIASPISPAAPTETVRPSEDGSASPARRGLAELSADDWKVIRAVLEIEMPSSLENLRRLSSDRAFANARETVRGKFPTVEPDGRGELTHPAVVTALIEALLENAGVPLDEEQWKAAEELVADYTDALADVQNLHGANTPKFEKVIDEVGLKQDFLDALSEGLSEPQRTALRNVSPAGEDFPAIASPLVMADFEIHEVPTDSLDELRAGFASELADDFEISLESAAVLNERYFAAIAPLLRNGGESWSTIDRALLAGRAQIELFRPILELPDLDDRARRKIVERLRWLVMVPAE